MQQRSNVYTFVFALIICLVCSIGLAMGATALKPMQVTNYRLDIMHNIISASGFPEDKLSALSAKEVLELFRSKFAGQILDKNNQPVERKVLEDKLRPLGYSDETLHDYYVFELVETFNKKVSILARRAGQDLKTYDPGYKLLFAYKPGDKVEAYIMPIEGYGLWDMMYGYLALAPDLNTIKGIRFYNHKETPGLGGEAEKPWFTSQYTGKKILDENGELVSIKVAKAKATGPYEVDGISGATLTGKGITEFMKEDLMRYEPYFKTLRSSEPGDADEGAADEDETEKSEEEESEQAEAAEAAEAEE